MTTLIPKFNQPGSSTNSPISQKIAELLSSADYSTWGSKCYSIGSNNLPATSTGVENIVYGYNSLSANTTGYANIVIGTDALKVNTTGYFNISIGGNTLITNTTGYNNHAFGLYALYSNTTGFANVALSQDALRYNSTGSENLAAGVQSLYNNLTGYDNVALGTFAARGTANPPDTAFGTGPSPSQITAVGAYSLYQGTGTYNASVGYQSGYACTGNYNSFLGAGAGVTLTSGSYNVYLGYNSGQNASQAAIVNSCIALGDNTYTTGNNAVAIGSGVSAPANHVVIGNSFHTFVRTTADGTTNLGGPSNRWATVYAATGTINTSDANQKTDIVDISDVEKRVAVKLKSSMKRFKFKDGTRYHFGTIAQDVKAAFESEGLVAEEYGVFCSDTLEDGTVRLGIRYDELFAFIISAL